MRFLVFVTYVSDVNFFLTAEDYARLCGYSEIIEQIKSAPQVATWDAGTGR